MQNGKRQIKDANLEPALDTQATLFLATMQPRVRKKRRKKQRKMQSSSL